MSEAENEINNSAEDAGSPEIVSPVSGPFQQYQPGRTVGGVKIQSVVLSTPEFVVYRGEDQKTYFDADKKVRQRACGKSLRRSEVLESMPVAHLSPEHVESFRKMVDQGVVSALEGESKTACETLDMAQRYVDARNRETARRWYFKGSSATAFGFVLLALMLWSFFSWDEMTTRLLLAFAAGSVGAYLSVLSRLGKLPSDPSSGRLMHFIDGFARVFVGALGGVIVALAVRSKLLFAFAMGNENGAEMTELIILFCIVAGLSERIVPNFIESMEAKAGKPTPSEDDK